MPTAYSSMPMATWWSASAGARELHEQAPMAYQESEGVRHPVEARYRIVHGKTVAFDLAAYDVTRPLVIDPVISYSTYMGGTAIERRDCPGRRRFRQSLRGRLDRGHRLSGFECHSGGQPPEAWTRLCSS